MKIQICQMEIKAGHPSVNTEYILQTIKIAKSQAVDLLVFPELCISGYLLGQLWETNDFLHDCAACGEKIREATENISVIFGNVAIDLPDHNTNQILRKYNALFFAENKQFLIPENTQQPFLVKLAAQTEDTFAEAKKFLYLKEIANEKNISITTLLSPFVSRLGRIACSIGNIEQKDDSIYFQTLNQKKFDLFVTIHNYPFRLNTPKTFHQTHAQTYQKNFVYVNSVGIQNTGKTIYTYSGQSAIYTPSGACKILTPAFQEINYQWDTQKEPIDVHTNKPKKITQAQEIFESLHYGIQTFLKQLRIQKVVIGLSGGIDSAVSAALYGTFIKPENLLLVNMPSQFNSDLTKKMSREMATRLNCLYTEIPVSESVAFTQKQLDNLMIYSSDRSYSTKIELKPSVIENVQARDRSSRILAALTASFGAVFTCNGNKSESAVGYATLYGDLTGFLAAIGDLWKYQVYELGQYLNQEIYQKEVIPKEIFTIKPSAELGPQQDITKGLGDPLIYEYHDRLFQSWTEHETLATPETILRWYLDKQVEAKLGLLQPLQNYFKTSEDFINDLERWWKLFQGMSVAKRIQAPPNIGLKMRPFGSEFSQSQYGAYFTLQYTELKQKILASQ